ncbi:3-hydroxyacyl-ACP dehydratase FabZ family protein [Stratiformator vulcanicus]|uniref:3-hydroxyacyl-[acyl-carrier-protein] dehydratase FabZ n=1 Tax=Stratiformator vulcanicus TaxID=2527980 RepID=A0A517R1N2_9PLAN|nr:3-hydroxyacyl-ACP dehydratase FabZ family protein [Stratiformator vulcanicus]QDT37782.1 3-hydroxyacyl-[acyl-carrier-protein] dehydratase FabZ [Stratiformator vulcanicus]
MLNKAQIQDLIPHRDPFLWLDEVVEVDEQKIHARKHLDPSIWVFQGHYPDFPVLPGVIQCEMCFQASAVLIAPIQPVEDGKVPVVARANKVKFRRMVRPGDTVEIYAEITDRLKDTFYLTGKIMVGDDLAMRCDFASTAAKPR